MKALSLFLQELNGGTTHAACTADLAELFKTVQETGRKGALKLTITVAPGSKGSEVDKVIVSVDRTLALPKAEPTRNHPRQHALDLRDASKGDDKPAEFKTAT
jgi:hypothetical protein